jgi:hypothetical protein
MKSLASYNLSVPYGISSCLPLVDKFWPKYEEKFKCEISNQFFCSKYCYNKTLSLYKKIWNNNNIIFFQKIKEICRKIKNNFPMQVMQIYMILLNNLEEINDVEKVWNNSPFSLFYSSEEQLNLNSLYPGMNLIYNELPFLFKFYLQENNQWNELFSPKFFCWLYNIVHLNCSQLRPKTPFNIYIDHIKKVRPQETFQQLGKMILNINHEAAKILQWDEDDQDDFISSKLTRSIGSGLFILHSCINHSCSPNAKVVSENFVDASIDVVALKDINEGAEIW